MQINSVPDFMSEVYDLLYYVTGNDQIFRGNQSREVLPKDNDYIIYTPIAQKRIGTNVTAFDAGGVAPEDDAPERNSKLLQVDLQIDCYGDKSFAYAEGLETFAGSERCNNWLIQNGAEIRVLHASDPMDGTLVDDTQQYVTRWIVTLSICLTVSVTDPVPWMDDVIWRIINVDVAFPPKEE